MPYFLLPSSLALVIPDPRILSNSFCQPKLCLSLLTLVYCLFYWFISVLFFFFNVFSSNLPGSRCWGCFGRMKKQRDEASSRTEFLKSLAFDFNGSDTGSQRATQSQRSLEFWKRESESLQIYCLFLVLLNFGQRRWSMYYQFFDIS